MKPAAFDYLRAGSVSDATAALFASDGGGKAISGGLSLGPLLNLRMARLNLLVDLNRIPGLNRIVPAEGFVRVGALVRHQTMREQSVHPLAAEAARWIGHGAIRFRGTFGGSIAHADPSAEWPCVATACDAEFALSGHRGHRVIDPATMFHGALQTDLQSDEILTSISLRLPQRWGFCEYARRKGDFALAIAIVTQLADGWRVVLGGVAPTPLRIREAEHLLDAHGLTTSVRKRIPRMVAATVHPTSDLHGGTEYRRALSSHLVSEALERMS